MNTIGGRLPPLSEEIKQSTIEMFNQCNGNKAEAARRLGIHVNTFKSRLIAATKDSSVQGLDQFIPEGQKLRGVSTLYNKEGDAVLQWVKTNADLERQFQLLQEAVEALKSDIPKEKPCKYKGKTLEDLVTQYTITDYHIGLKSWIDEVGEDWDTEKSENFLVAWLGAAIAAAPASKNAILLQLGDLLHFDSIDPVTPTSKHIMDTDSRYAFVVRVVIRALRRIVDMMLQKHEHVHIIMAEGNHDITSSIWLRALFASFYENEPRVTVDNSSIPYYAYEWVKTALFYHHGHKKKLSDISRVFASLFRGMFGRTKYAYVHMGHYHHVASKEDGLMIVEQHTTMAAPSSHDVRSGYNSIRGANVITYSKQFGEVHRTTIRPEMITVQKSAKKS